MAILRILVAFAVLAQPVGAIPCICIDCDTFGELAVKPLVVVCCEMPAESCATACCSEEGSGDEGTACGGRCGDGPISCCSDEPDLADPCANGSPIANDSKVCVCCCVAPQPEPVDPPPPAPPANANWNVHSLAAVAHVDSTAIVSPSNGDWQEVWSNPIFATDLTPQSLFCSWLI